MSHWRSVLVVLSVVAGQCVALDAPTSAPSSEPVKGKAGYTPTHMSTSWLFASCFLILLGVIGGHLFYFFYIKKVPFRAPHKPLNKYSNTSSIPGNRNQPSLSKSATFLLSRKITREVEKNSAFIFLKPHVAGNDKITGFIQNFFLFRNMMIPRRGVLTISPHLWENLIDRTYTEACRLAMIVKPRNYRLTGEEKASFSSHFGKDWNDCIENRVVLNAVESCSYLGISHKELLDMWVINAGIESKYVDISTRLKCCYLDSINGKPSIYCINGFYLGLRGVITNKAVSVPFFVVEWQVGQYSWEFFTQKIIGDENPSTADVSTLRGALFREWKMLELRSQPNIVDNCIHASESAFSALIEKKMWIPNWDIYKDYFFRQLLKNGIGHSQIERLEKNPRLAGPDNVHVYSFLKNHDAVSSLPIVKEIVLKRGQDLVYDM